MARIVAEVMNHELFAVRENDAAGDTLGNLLGLGITAAPVLDAEGHPQGVVSLRDLWNATPQDRVSTHMTAPAATVRSDATIETAADVIADAGVHHLVATDDENRAIGFLGSLDIIRGLRGKPVGHPSAFPHFDLATGLAWSDDTVLASGAGADVPESPGLLVLILGRAGQDDRVVWSEATANLHRRVHELLAPSGGPPHLQDAIAAGSLRFRAAPVASARALMRAMTDHRHADAD